MDYPTRFPNGIECGSLTADGTIAATGKITGATGQFGGTADYSAFEADGTLKFTGGATVWKDINISGATLVPNGATAPDLVNFVDANIQLYGFDGGGTVEKMYGTIELQHDYKEGTDIEVHIHWAPATNSGGNVLWQMYLSWTNSGDAFAAGTLTKAPASAAGSTAWVNKFVSVTTLSGVGKGINSHLAFQIFRDGGDAADTYAGDAILLQVGIHYECDTCGSRAIHDK